MGNSGSFILAADLNHRLRDPSQYFRSGVTWSKISSRAPSFRLVEHGVLFGDGGPMIIVEDPIAMTSLLNSVPIETMSTIINPTVNNQTKDILNLPYPSSSRSGTLEKHLNVFLFQIGSNSRRFVVIRIAASAWSSDNIVADYRIMLSENHRFFHAKNEKLNRIFIDIYGLQGGRRLRCR